MKYILASFSLSFTLSYLFVKFSHFHLRYTVDTITNETRKTHISQIPRIGGIPIYLGIVLTIIILSNLLEYYLYLFIILTAIFIIGLAEDLSKKLSVRIRFCGIIIISLFFVLKLNYQIKYTDIFLFDHILNINNYAAVLFTTFCIVGLINSYNIIDGMNGLSSIQGLLASLSIMYISKVSGLSDSYTILNLCLIGSVLGLIFLNFPYGKIFMGDGGAYLLGFLISILSINCSIQNKSISPWFFILINAYPFTETIFSLFRRFMNSSHSAISADALHLHSLIFRRILFNKYNNSKDKKINANILTTLSLLVLSIFPFTTSLIFYKNTSIIIICLLIYITIYFNIYFYLLFNKKIKWLTQ